MTSSSTVPLMMDIEGGPEEEYADNDSAIKNDFAYNNNVAGAAKHIRMGKKRSTLLFCLHSYSN